MSPVSGAGSNLSIMLRLFSRTFLRPRSCLLGAELRLSVDPDLKRKESGLSLLLVPFLRSEFSLMELWMYAWICLASWGYKGQYSPPLLPPLLPHPPPYLPPSPPSYPPSYSPLTLSLYLYPPPYPSPSPPPYPFIVSIAPCLWVEGEYPLSDRFALPENINLADSPSVRKVLKIRLRREMDLLWEKGDVGNSVLRNSSGIVRFCTIKLKFRHA